MGKGSADDGEWHTAVSVREQRRKEKIRTMKQVAAKERAIRVAEDEEKRLAKERELEARKKEIESAFSIKYSPNIIANQRTKTGAKKRRNKSKGNKTIPNTTHAQSSSLTYEATKRFIDDANNLESNDLKLKRLAEYFENGYSQVKVFDPKEILNISPLDEEALDDLFSSPIMLTKQPVRNYVKGWLTTIAKEELEPFFWFLVLQLAPILSEDKIVMEGNGTGLYALLQLLIQIHPAMFRSEFSIKKMKRFCVLPKKSQLLATIHDITKIKSVIVTTSIPLFTFVFYQLQTFPSIFLSVWYQYLFPLLCYGSTSSKLREIVVLSFHAVFCDEERLEKGAVSRNDANYAVGAERLIILYFSLEDSPFKDLIEPVYDTIIQRLSIFATKKTPRHYFSKLLPHAIPGLDSREEELSNTICHLLSSSLVEDDACYSRWKEIYTQCIPQSNILLRHIIQQWKRLKSHINRSEMMAECRFFLEINKQILACSLLIETDLTPKRQRKMIRSCSKACKKIIKKAETNFFFFLIQMAFFVLLLAFIAFYFTCLHDGCHYDYCGKVMAFYE